MKCKMMTGLMCTVSVLALIAGATAQSQNQSLGDYARAVKKTKPASTSSEPKVYDNDNIPASSSLSVVGAAPSSDTDPSKTSDQAKDAGQQTSDQAKTEEKKPQITPDQSSEEREKAIQAWKQKLEAQKTKIDLASRELDVMQREYRVKQAEFYADTARRVQNPAGFAADDAKYKQQIADRQKAVDEAKKKLSDLQDEARKAGVPNSTLE